MAHRKNELTDYEYWHLIYAGITIEEYLIQGNEEFKKWIRRQKRLSRKQ